MRNSLALGRCLIAVVTGSLLLSNVYGEEKSAASVNVRRAGSPSAASRSTGPTLVKLVEQESVALLAMGKQREAETLLKDYVGELSDVPVIIQFLEKGKQAEAMKAMAQNTGVYRENQRVLFLFAACCRSRFMRMTPYLTLVGMIDNKTPVGKCAVFMTQLDEPAEAHSAPDRVFNGFVRVVKANPDNVVLRWMLAEQCRTYRRSAQGAVHCRQILDAWTPGPVLLHQTYANLLDDLGRYEEALIERQTAVMMEPADWAYDGLGNTLDNMKEYDEAAEAHARACQLAPKNGHHLGNWAANSLFRNEIDDAINQCRQATKLDPSYARTWDVWGQCLESQGKKTDAAEKYRKALQLAPQASETKLRLDALERAQARK
jgi:tetratricopeptide (TPR) repeat protein